METWHLAPDGTMRRLGAAPSWAKDDRGRWRADVEQAAAELLRDVEQAIHDEAPAFANVAQVRQAFGIPVPKRSPWPALAAAEIAKGATRADAIGTVAKTERVEPKIVEQAMRRVHRQPPAPIARQVWRADERGEWQLVYDIGGGQCEGQ